MPTGSAAILSAVNSSLRNPIAEPGIIYILMEPEKDPVRAAAIYQEVPSSEDAPSSAGASATGAAGCHNRAVDLVSCAAPLSGAVAKMRELDA